MFRRDIFTQLALAGVVLGLLFSMGKYTPFYWFLYEHFPGINHFRVPKMMMIIPALSLGVLAARGLDALMDDTVRSRHLFKCYLWGLGGLTACMVILWGVCASGKDFFISRFIDILGQPTRYEQGVQLVMQRWNNVVREAGIAAAVIATYAAVIVVFVKRLVPIKYLPVVLICLYLGDIWRINDKFMLLQDVPVRANENKTPTMEFLSKDAPAYRVLVADNTDPMRYASQGIPVMFTSNPVQKQRWQEFLDSFSLTSPMPDIMNVRYLVMSSDQAAQQQKALGPKYEVAFQDPARNKTVERNRSVLPKAWLVPSVVVITNPGQRLGIMASAPEFKPDRIAIVESPPPLQLAPYQPQANFPAGSAEVLVYKPNRIVVDARAARNSLLVLGEKYYNGWKVTIDGKPGETVPVDHILRGVYLPSGDHRVEFIFDPLPFKVGKWLTLASLVFFAGMLTREWLLRRKLRL